MLLFLFAVFFAGAALGSFLNVLIDRLPRNEPIVQGRSKCASCRKTLKLLDLIPIFSYLWLLGRCRYCHAVIPLRILLVEVLGAILALILFLLILSAGISLLYAIFLFVIILSFLGIFFADFEYGIIPDEFVIAIALSSLFFLIMEKPYMLAQNFLVGIISFLLFFSIYSVTSGRGMGFGDVKLAGAIGLFLGFPNIIVGTYAAFLTALCFSIILILTGKKKLRGGTIAFGPFLSIGAVTGYFFGPQILNIFI
jgi:leader peptidase (prepilin peptidase)/N-methyltransferase